ncbi:MAG: PAS domain-containing protein [Nitrosospira sp.]|nr:PAS domain-containing protein [Nitrosospira sp.]
MKQPEMPGWLPDSEMGELIFARDWTESGLGPIAGWPPHLELAVSIILSLPSAAVLLWGPNLIQIYNSAFRDLMGGKHPGGLGQMASACWPEAWSFIGPICEGVMKRGASFSFDEQRLVLNRSGTPEEAFFNLTYSPVPGGTQDLMPSKSVSETGVPGGVLVTVSETTELVRARANEAERARLNEALQAKRIRLLEEVFRHAPSFLQVLRGPEFVFEFANDAYYQLVGQRELIGRPAFEAIPESAEGGYQHRLNEVMATGKAFMGFELPVTLARTAGQPPEVRFIDLVYLPLCDEDGTFQRILGHGIDVTQHVQKRKQAEEALRESEEKFRAMAEASPALIWQVDASGNISYLSQRCMDMVGMTREELMQGGWRMAFHLEDGSAYLAAVRQALGHRSPLEHRVRVRNGHGEWRWLNSYALPWFTPTGDYAGHIGLSIDITDAVEAETALLEADRCKDEFLAMLAHELRNPLAPISNALAIIDGPGGAEALSQLLPIISRQVNHMVRLVDDLLEISRITSGKIELRRATMDLALVLRNAVEASMAQIAENEQVLSTCTPEEPLPVHADAVRLEQVFTNLLNNAARYTPKGGHIWLTLRQEGDNAIVSVLDNGIGILPGMLPRLFDMFAQERRSGVGAQEGLGIGLNLVQRLVRMHGGSVEVKSEGKNRGSEFIVRLPLSQSSQSSESSESPAHGPGAEPEIKAAPLSPMRVLVVDDNRDAGEVLAMLLESTGLHVRSVDSGPAALAAIPDYQPNVILMDIGMPGMTGHEVARHIRQQPEYGDIKLVALTGWGQEEDRRLSRESGFDHHLTKPVDFTVLKNLIGTLQGSGAGH